MPARLEPRNTMDTRRRDGIVDREALYQVLLPSLTTVDSSVIPSLLLAGNKALHRHAERAAYHTLTLNVAVPGYTSAPDPSANAPRKKVECVFRNPRLGSHVRSLTFRQGVAAYASSGADKDTRDARRQGVFDLASASIGMCPDVTELRWETGLGVSSALWKAISVKTRLRRLALVPPEAHPGPIDPSTCLPRLTPRLQLLAPPGLGLLHGCSSSGSLEESPLAKPKIVGQGGWGLGSAGENLEVLEIANLSQAGAKTLAAHLTMLSDYPAPLHTLRLRTHFLDMALLTAISRVGSLGTLRHLELATSGTKLTAECLKEVVEGCKGLESLVLDDVEGRLDKNSWRMIEDWPVTLRSIEIRIAESGSHHSWVLHHLSSIHHLPIGQLTRLVIRRLVHPVAELPYPPSTVLVPPVQAGHLAETIPAALLDAILDRGQNLEEVCLDWWIVDVGHLESMLKALPELRKLRLAVRSGVAKITNMTTLFAAVPHLETLAIISPAAFNATTGPFKPCGTTEELALLPDVISRQLEDGDQTLPEVRDLRKFARRLTRLKTIIWTGREGKGSWHFTKKSSTLVTVTFVHAAVSLLDTWSICQSPAPVFDFDEDAGGMILEVPPPPVSANQADFPSLTRSTTNSSSRTSLHTPMPPSPTAVKRDVTKRRSLPPPIKENKGPALQSPEDPEKSRKSTRAPPTAKSTKSLPSPRTPSTPHASLEPHTDRDWSNKPKKSYSGVLEDVTRHVPGSGRIPAVPITPIDTSRSACRQSLTPSVTIAEDDEDVFEPYDSRRFGQDDDAGWTMVAKDKPKDKVKPVAEKQPSPESNKSKRKNGKAKK